MSSPGSCALCGRSHCLWHATVPRMSTRLTLRWQPVLGIYAHGACVAYLLETVGDRYGIDFTPIVVVAAGIETHEWELENEQWALTLTARDKHLRQKRAQRFVRGSNKIAASA